jgi:hypothetical protein
VCTSIVASGARRPGIYRAVIQADGAPRLWLPLEVEVAPC